MIGFKDLHSKSKFVTNELDSLNTVITKKIRKGIMT